MAEEASGTKYVSQDLLDAWAKKDPISNFEAYLLKNNEITVQEIENFKADYTKEIKNSLEIAFEEAEIIPDLKTELSEVYHPYDYKAIKPGSKSEKIRLIDAISEGLKQSMEQHPDLVIMGQDIAEYGGVFKITDGFPERFTPSTSPPINSVNSSFDSSILTQHLLEFYKQFPEACATLTLESTSMGIKDPHERNNRVKMDSDWANLIKDDPDLFLEK